MSLVLTASVLSFKRVGILRQNTDNAGNYS